MKKIQNNWIDEELILNDSGSFERMWDYMGGDQEDQLPFSFYAGTAEKFSPPRITARKNSRTLLFESKSLQVTLSLDPQYSYRMAGEIVPAQKMAVFSLNTLVRNEG